MMFKLKIKEKTIRPSTLKSFKELDFNKIFTNRLRIFLGLLTIVFILLLVKLFDVQILNQAAYQQKLENFTQAYQSMASPRGEIYDRKGEILVTNTERLAFVYFPPLNTNAKKEWDLALRMADTFEFDISTLTMRDLKDLFITLYPEQAKAKITQADWDRYQAGELSDLNIYNLKLDRITQTDLSILDARTQEAFIVKSAMSASPYQSLKIIKDNVSMDEVAYLIEHINQYPGFDVNVYFDRSYPQGSLLKGLMGGVTNSKQGLSSENLLYYLALGYSRNSSIGRSGVEMQYESLLKGSNSTYSIAYNEDGLALLNEAQKGSKGQDLTLSIDLGLQRQIETILGNTLLREQGNPFRAHMETIYVVAMNPQSGDILGMAGMKTAEDKSVFNDPVSTYTDSFAAGSVVKGAVVYMGLSEGLIRPGEVILDAPIKIADTPLKRSWKDLGLVNDLTALSMSSNVYMFNIAMRLGGADYSYNMPLNIDLGAFDTIRSYFSQFGLGTLTGIDVPNESLGYRGFSMLGGHLLDFAIGQYDTYTALQLAQYVSTIANDGVRVKPRLLIKSELSDSSITSYENPVTILSTLDHPDALDRVQQGFRLCVTDGLCKLLGNLPVSAAAKTGTAESFLVNAQGDSFDSPNSVLISYAPYDQPEIAISCAIPHAWNTTWQANLCLQISDEIYAYYFQNR